MYNEFDINMFPTATELKEASFYDACFEAIIHNIFNFLMRAKVRGMNDMKVSIENQFVNEVIGFLKEKGYTVKESDIKKSNHSTILDVSW